MYLICYYSAVQAMDGATVRLQLADGHPLYHLAIMSADYPTIHYLLQRRVRTVVYLNMLLLLLLYLY